MENGWYEGQKLGNRNVPVGVHIYGSMVNMDGEVIETFYHDPVKKADYMIVGWARSEPQMLVGKFQDVYKKFGGGLEAGH